MKKPLIVLLIMIITLLSACSPKIDAREIPVLLYHMVKENLDDGDDPLMVVTTSKFEEDLKYLKDNGYTAIGLETLLEAYSNPRVKLPRNPVVITFDDGYLNNYVYAFPLLKRYDTRAVIFTIVWSVGRDKFIFSDNPINPHFSWEQGKEMIDSGFIELGSHTYDLHNPYGTSYGYEVPCGYGLGPIEGEDQDDYYGRIFSDLKKSKETMEENLGVEIKSLAYPYGIYNETIIKAAKDLGFQLAFITESQEPSRSLFEIKRIIVGEGLRMANIFDNRK